MVGADTKQEKGYSGGSPASVPPLLEVSGL